MGQIIHFEADETFISQNDPNDALVNAKKMTLIGHKERKEGKERTCLISGNQKRNIRLKLKVSASFQE